VREKVENFAVFLADVTTSKPSPAIDLLRQLRIPGTPTIVFLGPDGKEMSGFRLQGYHPDIFNPEGDIFPQMLEMVKEAYFEAKKAMERAAER